MNVASAAYIRKFLRCENVFFIRDTIVILLTRGCQLSYTLFSFYCCSFFGYFCWVFTLYEYNTIYSCQTVGILVLVQQNFI